ncbi:MAG: asparagine synthase (glutamine-hydrolyzing) [Defluviitaleaceae bacterium]|nr:asparagine synthase (glutamine-hydrolyzing) [Defluviitaleaceae bacterium]
MCGFCGFSGQNPEAEVVINKMLDKIIHRGPDSAGVYLGEEMTLGFRRLSIIDLENGAQPMYNETGSLVLVFNGEIYNHKELRALLEEKGHYFTTSTDAEVLLHLYEEHGTGMLNHLRGMFAFAIYDMEADKLFCARDPFGIKPFYYTRTEKGLIFGSEIKSFTVHPGFTPMVNPEALAQYLTFQYSVLTETFFKGVYKLPPGHHLTLENGDLAVARYHSHIFSPAEMSLDDAAEQIDVTIGESIFKHMASDVEVGSFLSGGVDSSYTVARFGGKKTFTVGFDYENYNEIEYAKSLSEQIGAENFSKIITTDEFWESLSKVQYHMDEPLADPAAVALYFVSREAAKHVKAVLSGEGADELFGGYNIYKEPLSLKWYAKLPLSLREWLASLAKKLPVGTKGRGFLLRGAKTVEERYIGGAYIFAPEERAKILKFEAIQEPMDITRPFYAQVKHEDDITKMQYLDIHLWLAGDILLKADKMSMAHCLEVRVPFLDREVFRVASRLLTKHRVSKKGTKLAFRKAAAAHLPQDVADRRKLGFPVPIRIWLREEKYYNVVKTHFTSSVASRYFNIEALLALLDEHYSGKQDNSRKIWTVFMFLLWHSEYFLGESA